MENSLPLARIPAKILIWWDKIAMKLWRSAPDDSSATPVANCNCAGKLKESMGGLVVTLMVISVVLAMYAALRNPRWDEVWTGFGAGNFSFQMHQAATRQHDDFIHKDDPVDDLLPTGFNKKSCRSRFESASYRRGVLKRASPDLVSRLRRYEALHKKCGPYTDSYNNAVKDLKLGRSPTAPDCKYVVWVPLYGLGNRIITITSAFLYALLTDQVLLVDRGFDIPDLFCEPFPEASWILPSDFPLANRFIDFNKKSKESYGKQLVPQLNRTELNNLFPDKEAVFHLLGRYLFHPTNSAWGFITRYYRTYLSKADIKVGIQARVVNHRLSPLNKVLDQILSCTIRENILPEINRTEHIIDDLSTKQKTVAVLVTSLNSLFSEAIKKKYLEHPTVTGELISVHQPTHEEYQRTDTRGHNKKAWIEMYLLSLMDKLVTSPRSTFGYVAQGLGGVEPWVLTPFVKEKKVPDPVCQRDTSMEPCFFSAYYDCRLKRQANPAEFPYVKQCVDAFRGFKLVHPHD